MTPRSLLLRWLRAQRGQWVRAVGTKRGPDGRLLPTVRAGRPQRGGAAQTEAVIWLGGRAAAGTAPGRWPTGRSDWRAGQSCRLRAATGAADAARWVKVSLTKDAAFHDSSLS